MKYTIIYSDGRLIGSHYSAVTKMERVETGDLEGLVSDRTDIWFIFEGWPELEGEFKESK